jgi:PAS domain S-box-containing protein
MILRYRMGRKMKNKKNIEVTEAILNCMGDGVISTDMDGRINYMNAAAEDITGFKAKDAMGHLFDSWLTFFHDAAGKPYESLISRVVNYDASTCMESNTPFKTKDGHIKYLSVNCSLIKGKNRKSCGVLIIFRDISRLKYLELQHIDEKNNFKSIFNDAPIGMIIINDAQIITEANTFALNWIGKCTNQVIGKRFGESFNCKSSIQSKLECGSTQSCVSCKFNQAFALALKEKQATFNEEINKLLLIDGKEIEVWLKINVSPITVDGKSYSLMTLMDITEMKNTEIALRVSEEKYKNLFDYADKANKTKNDFLANMSHEIRTPINGVLGMVELTLLTDLQKEQRENLDLAMTCANSLLNIINDILDFSKIEAGKLVIENTSFKIVELVEELIKSHLPRAIQKGLEFRYTFSSTVPEYIVGDSNRLRQILNNLITNAVKFTESGRITLIVNNNSEKDGFVELEFSVEDTGIGIADEHMVKLFKSFSQVDSSFTKKYGGTGLGLAISKQLVEMMGGTIWARSEKDKGSTFNFRIKFIRGNKELLVQKMEPINQTAVKLLDILVVEDDQINKLVFSKMVKQKGHRVEFACNGEEALKLLSNKRFDIIFMDIQMPVMDGITATKMIRDKEANTSHTPIIAITAHALQGDREKYLSLGMDEYLSKPINWEKLFLILDKFSSEENYWNELTLNKIKTDENGKVIIVRSDKSQSISLEAIKEYEQYFNEIEAFVKNDRFAEIEKNAFKISTLAESVSDDNLKVAALKIKFAARRKDMDAVINCVNNFKKACLMNN